MANWVFGTLLGFAGALVIFFLGGLYAPQNSGVCLGVTIGIALVLSIGYILGKGIPHYPEDRKKGTRFQQDSQNKK